MNRRKSLFLIAMVALLLTFTVSGTIAWLAASTGELVNTFTPGKIDTELEEEFDNQAKTKIVVKNAEDSTVPVFVRVSVTGYYVKDVLDADNQPTGEVVIVEPWGGLTDGQMGEGWLKGSDGFYYYSTSVAPRASTSNLLKSGINLLKRDDGSYPVINVVHQSIQYTPVSAVNGAWPAVVATDNGTSGTLTLKQSGT